MALMHPSRRYLIAFVLAVAATLAVVPVIGNSLPAPHGSFIPMLVDHDFIRDEHIIRNALAEERAPCVALVGDSRVAFNVSGAIVEHDLPRGCAVQNYGFPAFGFGEFSRFLSSAPPRAAVVVSVSESMLFGGDGAEPSRWAAWRWSALRSRAWYFVVSFDFGRTAYLGLHRVARLWRIATGQRPGDSGWIWRSDEKYWRAGIDGRVMASLPTYAVEVENMAKSYFDHRGIDDGRDLTAFVLKQRARVKTVILVIPPSEARFREVSKRYGPAQHEAWNVVRRVAESTEAALIDCSTDCVPQSGFADPVHLNAEGVRAYSKELSRRIAEVLGSS